MNAIGAPCLLMVMSLTAARPETGAFSIAGRYGVEVEPLPERSGGDKLTASASASCDPFMAYAPTRCCPQALFNSRNERLWNGRFWRKTAVAIVNE
jgi:hypothetical protein